MTVDVERLADNPFKQKATSMDQQLTSNVRRMRRPAHHPSSPGRRMRANWPAELRIGSTRVSCHVIDISVSGAKLKTVSPLPQTVAKAWLVLDGLSPIETELMWQNRGLVGIRFRRDCPEISEMQMRRFDPSAWLSRGGNAAQD